LVLVIKTYLASLREVGGKLDEKMLSEFENRGGAITVHEDM